MARRKMERRMEFWGKSLVVGPTTPGLSPVPRIHVARASYSNLYGALSHTLPLVTMAPCAHISLTKWRSDALTIWRSDALTNLALCRTECWRSDALSTCLRHKLMH